MADGDAVSMDSLLSCMPEPLGCDPGMLDDMAVAMPEGRARVAEGDAVGSFIGPGFERGPDMAVATFDGFGACDVWRVKLGERSVDCWLGLLLALGSPLEGTALPASLA